METVKRCMEKHPDSQVHLKMIGHKFKIILFKLNSKFYLQIKGTAMGKKFAPLYANIFMAAWEESARSSFPLKPHTYFHFLDDICGIWKHSKESFIEFTEQSSGLIIKFTMHRTVNFLDVVSYKGPSFKETHRLDFRVYFNETDKHCLLHKQSFHPKHTFRGIIKSQLLRFHRICSEKVQFCKATNILFSALKQRNYSRSFLRTYLSPF